MTTKQRKLTRTLVLGALTLALYAGLFVFEQAVLDISRQGRWWFAVPVGVAFLFSLVHGAFTSEFWDTLGVRAKK